jgi:voltage-gated potassium channel
MSTIDEHLERVEWGKQQEDGQVLLSPAWEVFVLGVSLLSVFNLFFGWALQNPHILQVVVIMDSMLTIVFLIDLSRRLVVADSNTRYLVHGKGWIDVLSTIPLLRIFRIFRMVRVVRIMRRLGGPETAFRAFFSNKAAGGLLSVVLVAILVMEFGALLILLAEYQAPDATITTAEDATWYVIVTMSTVGYGDVAPVTSVGRLTGALIIVVGVGVFGTLTGFLANAFLSPSAPADDIDSAILADEVEPEMPPGMDSDTDEPLRADDAETPVSGA